VYVLIVQLSVKVVPHVMSSMDCVTTVLLVMDGMVSQIVVHFALISPILLEEEAFVFLATPHVLPVTEPLDSVPHVSQLTGITPRTFLKATVLHAQMDSSLSEELESAQYAPLSHAKCATMLLELAFHATQDTATSLISTDALAV